MKKIKKTSSLQTVLLGTIAAAVTVASVSLSPKNVDFETYQEMRAYIQMMNYEHQKTEKKPFNSVKLNREFIIKQQEEFAKRKISKEEERISGFKESREKDLKSIK